MRILIDTNIFLDFYRSNKTPINIFSTLLENIEKCILTDQIIQEFERSRELVLKNVKYKFQQESKLENFSSSYLQNLEVFKELIEIQKQYKTKQKEVNNYIDDIIKDPTLDPISDYFNEFVNASLKNNVLYYTNDTIIRKAKNRKLIGNPPTSDKYSLGDEINWEIVLENIKEDIIIVGRDNTYTNNISYLQKDFHKRTGFYITEVTESISYAMKKTGVNTSKELEEEEAATIKEIRYSNEYWKHKTYE
ncbi:MAG: PIN-like domain-containing protein [Chitinophagales bacterium]|jgi:predicted nucleic acid-binding protein|nr:PIN-like domain-containing protein [Chitinophagales bacterium]